MNPRFIYETSTEKKPDVKKAEKKGNVVYMTGDIYNLEDKDDRPYTFEATAKPYKWNGKDTWAIISLSSQSKD